jgi:predicted RNA-binding Zn-ribbon protein involved in translation (DUF1610 family)
MSYTAKWWRNLMRKTEPRCVECGAYSTQEWATGLFICPACIIIWEYDEYLVSLR